MKCCVCFCCILGGVLWCVVCDCEFDGVECGVLFDLDGFGEMLCVLYCVLDGVL